MDGGFADRDLPGDSDPDPAPKDPDPDATTIEESSSSFIAPCPSPPDDTRTCRPTVTTHPNPTSSDSSRNEEVPTLSTGVLSAAAAAAWANAASGSSSPSLHVSSEKVGVSEETIQANADVSRSSTSASGATSSTDSAERYASKEVAGTSADADTVAPTNSATRNVSGSGGTVPKTPRPKPMTISPAPFKRSASSKALAAAAAQINAGTAPTASSANPPASAAASPPGKASSSGGSNNSSAPAMTLARVGMTTEVESGAAESGTGVRTPTQSPMPRRRDDNAAASMASSNIPGPPPLSTSSPLHNMTSSSLLPSSNKQKTLNVGNNLTPGSLSKATASTSSTHQQKHQQPRATLDATVKLDPDPPLLTALREQPLHKTLPRPRRPSKCPLFCVFYSEFDIIVGPKLCYQSPDGFMDSKITVGIEDIHDLLAQEFALVFPTDKEKDQHQQKHSKAGESREGFVDAKRQEAAGSPVEATAATATRSADVNNESKLRNKGVNETAGRDRSADSAISSQLPDLSIPDIEGDKQEKGPAAEAVGSSVPSNISAIPAAGGEEGTKTSSSAASVANTGRPPIPLRRTDRTLPTISSSNSLQQQQSSQQECIENLARPGDKNQVNSSVDTSSSEVSAFDSIFDSISEYIITGNDLADKMICLSTHNMHILSRPTIIKDTTYERNSLLFSVGFVLRRVEDPRPFRLLLSKLAQTLRSMEVESRFLTDNRTRPQLRRILQSTLVSLNSRRSECNLLLDKANVLNLKLFRPPREPAPPVPDYAVPVLLRPEWQMDMYDWDLTINWILPHIDGFKHARLISQSSEVDLDMVLACLRVLRHHGVLALVDVFRYENIYECTPRAASLLAGEQAELLDEAYSFVSKGVSTRSDGSSCGSRASTPAAFLDNHHRNPLSQGIGDNPNAPSDRSVGRNVGFDPNTFIRPASGTTLVPPRQATFGGTSYPPLSASEALAHASIEASARFSRSPVGTSPARHGVSQTSSRLSVSASEGIHEAFQLPSRRKEKRLKSALAHLYSSCCREKSFGDILVEKVTEAPDKVKRTRSRGSSSGALDSSEHDNDTRHRQAGEMHSPPSRSTFSDASVESESHLAQEASMSSTPRENHRSGSPGRRKQSDSEVLDVEAWVDAFEYFDHRRFVTFGVIHGLIRRVHSWPLAYDLGPPEHEESDDKTDSASDSLFDDRSAHSDVRISAKSQPYYPSENYHHLSRKPYVSPTLQSVPFSAASPSPLVTALKSTTAPLSLGASAVTAEQQDGMNGQKLADERKATIDNQRKRLANCVAESMDGRRCDDELCCMYQKSLKDLLGLISTVNKGAIMVKAASASHT